jgi:ABC-type transport system involved in cytochrome c biogenesis permease subunit
MAGPALAGKMSAIDVSEAAKRLDANVDWSKARLIAVQDGQRYKTLDSFAREAMTEMTGQEHLPGLSPMASLFEWLFNRQAYVDAPVVRIKDKGIRYHIAGDMRMVDAQRVRDNPYLTPREMADPHVRERLDSLEAESIMQAAMRRVRGALATAQFIEQMIAIVPRPGAAADAAWFTPNDLLANASPGLFAQLGMDASTLPRGRNAVPGIAPETADPLLIRWFAAAKAWRVGDEKIFQQAIDGLADELPKLSPDGVYPNVAQRNAEIRYYSMGKFTWGYWLYLLAALVSVWAMVTRWRGPWIAALILVAIALGLHGYGLALRWYILGRIPAANMFEAVMFSAWVGIAVAVLLELIFRARVFVVGASVTGFFALVLGHYVIPGGGVLTSIMGILDDVMLRIHTVLIIASYALIFLAAVIAVVYLFGHYLRTRPVDSAQIGAILAAGGFVMYGFSRMVYHATGASADGLIVDPWWARWVFYPAAVVGLATLLVLPLLPWRSRSELWAGAIVLAVGGASLAYTPHFFVAGTALTMTLGGAIWAALTGAGIVWPRFMRGSQPALATSGAGGGAAAIMPGGAARGMVARRASEPLPGGEAGLMSWQRRPVLAGAMPGDEKRGTPAWLSHLDWCHLIILNMMFVMLFVGIILGAVWADYSWGRPWGWDPKEVFAMNTWLVYAILIHMRFVVKNKGLWTAWLSVAGCAMMAFNWCFVNFFIVGLHSYA